MRAIARIAIRLVLAAVLASGAVACGDGDGGGGEGDGGGGGDNYVTVTG